MLDHGHDAQHEDLESLFRAALSTRTSPSWIVFESCALGAVLIGLLMTGEAFNAVSDTEIGDTLRKIAAAI